MALNIARHRRFAWIEYQDPRDALMLASTFSSTKLGWLNLFEDLPLIKTPEAVSIPTVLSGNFNLPGDRIDRPHPLMNFSYLSDPQQRNEKGKVPQALILRPGANLRKILADAGQTTPPDIATRIRAMHDLHHNFLGRWLLNPGVKRTSATDGVLTFDSDFTEQADLVAVSGHGGGGAVFGDALGAFAAFELAKLMVSNVNVATSGRVKYLLVPSCTNLKEDNSTSWLPLLRKDNPFHGIFGYVDSYPGDEVGALIHRRFGELIQGNPDIPLLDAWKQANGSSPWGALMLESSAKNDTMRKWVTEAGLPDPAGGEKVLHFDARHPGGKAPQESFDFEATFHLANGTAITATNNRQQDADQRIAGFFPGQRGSLELTAPRGRFDDGDKMVVIFFYWRSTKLKVDLPQFLTFDPVPGKLRFLADQNKDSPNPPNRIDALEFTFGRGESSGVTLQYTVNAQAASMPGLSSDGASATTMGRFHVALIPNRSLGNFNDRIEMYTRGAFLRVP